MNVICPKADKIFTVSRRRSGSRNAPRLVCKAMSNRGDQSRGKEMMKWDQNKRSFDVHITKELLMPTPTKPGRPDELDSSHEFRSQGASHRS
jgi:hypothetical protein